ncbi:BlaI/MecI/CopY family transcriptional regulator [Anoxybacterium hadale]
MMVQQVSDSELELMKLIWDNKGKLLYAALMDQLKAKGRTWQKNTVITLLSRLVEKGLLKTSKIGRRNEYIAVVTEADYQAAQIKTFLDKLYEGDAKGLVATLIQRELLTPGDYEELKKFWERERETNERDL